MLPDSIENMKPVRLTVRQNAQYQCVPGDLDYISTLSNQESVHRPSSCMAQIHARCEMRDAPSFSCLSRALANISYEFKKSCAVSTPLVIKARFSSLACLTRRHGLLPKPTNTLAATVPSSSWCTKADGVPPIGTSSLTLYPCARPKAWVSSLGVL